MSGKIENKEAFYAWLDKQPDPLPERKAKSCPHCTISPCDSCRVFYMLIYLNHAVKAGHPDRRQLHNLKVNYDNKLAIALRDYALLCISGELRHSRHKIYNKQVNFPFTGLENKRREAMVIALSYSPDSILASALELFKESKYKWEGDYGGSSWRKIAQAVMKYGEIPNEKWIDRAWDLRHNGDIFFNRDTIFYVDECDLYDFLERKAEEEYDWEDQGLTLQEILKEYNKIIRTVMDYEPIYWGTKIFPFPTRQPIERNEEGQLIVNFTGPKGR